MANCLVLGANGFIGSHLVDSLINTGNSVRAFDRLGSKPLYEKNEKIEPFYGDFLNRSDLEDAIQDIDYVFHFISTTTPATSENDPLVDVDTNIRMSIELFQICAEYGVKRIIFASTGGAIYGSESDKPHSETDNPKPVSPYAIGKLTIEHYLRYFKVKHGLDYLVLRISNPYGERQPLNRKQGVIPIFLENICQGSPITIMGDGSMVRDYIYVGDVANIIADVFNRPTKHNTYNLGSGSGVTVSELVKVVERASGIKPLINHIPAPSTFVHKVVLDTSRITEEFGISIKIGLEEGARKTYYYIASELKSTKG